MPVGHQAATALTTELIRRVEVVRGTMAFRMECPPAFNYARQEHETKITAEAA